jgi:SHS2 domain-containing protein
LQTAASNMPYGWEHFVHGADVGVRGWGTTRNQAFEQAALALTAVVTDPARVQAATAVDIVCGAPDDQLLLADWLNALIYEMQVRHMLFSRFAVSITNDHQHLRATAGGEMLDPRRHRPAVEVKGATFTELAVKQRPDGTWLAQCVVDV